MTSRNLKRIAVSGGTIAVLLAIMVVMGSGKIAKAEDDGSRNGLEGAWRLQLTVRDWFRLME